MGLSFASFDWKNTPAEQAACRAEQQKPAELEIVFEDAWILVVNKPAGLSVQPDLRGQDSLMDQASRHLDGQPVFLVHRLDLPVCGLVVLAKTAAIQAALSKPRSQSGFAKTYRAVVSPVPKTPAAQLTNFLAKTKTENLSVVTAPGTPGAKRAELSYQLVAKCQSAGLSLGLLEINLLTGRHHQIRVQLAHAGFPIIGDRKYGSRTVVDSKPASVAFPALQACAVDLIHPISGQAMHWTIKPPDQWPWNCFESVAQVL